MIFAYTSAEHYLNSEFNKDVLEKPILKTGEEEIAPSLSRRNTIVPPPTLQEVELDLPEMEAEDEGTTEFFNKIE